MQIIDNFQYVQIQDLKCLYNLNYSKIFYLYICKILAIRDCS